jgi:hypothetical protein
MIMDDEARELGGGHAANIPSLPRRAGLAVLVDLVARNSKDGFVFVGGELVLSHRPVMATAFYRLPGR